MPLCRKISKAMFERDSCVNPTDDVFLNTDDEADSEREDADMPEVAPPANAEAGAVPQRARVDKHKAMIQKLHVNTGHASVPQMLRQDSTC